MAEEKNESRLLTAEERAKASKDDDARAAKTEYKPRTAHDVVAEVGPVDVEDANKRAKEAGVTDAAFIDYEEAMHNYESRSDVETLKDRRAREGGREFSDAAFRRKVGGNTTGVVTSEDATVEDDKDEKPAAKPAARRANPAK